MNILVILGSPNRNGSSCFLAEQFIEGAANSGCEIERFETAFSNVNPCRGCGYCRNHDGLCIHDDDMAHFCSSILSSDMVVLATPLYYFGMSSQLKSVIDRLYSINGMLRKKPLKAALIATSADNADWTMNALSEHYRAICRYLGWENCFELLAKGIHCKDDVESSKHPALAMKLGKEQY